MTVVFWCLVTEVLLFCVGPAFAKPKSKSTAKPWNTQWVWVQQPWTGDNRLFQQARTKIDTLTASGKKPASFLPQYQEAVKQNPSSPLRLFSWAYVVYKIATAPDLEWNAGNNMLARPLQALADAPSPHTAEYDRLRFLMISNSPFDNDKIKPLAHRLLRYNPNDVKVKSRLAEILAVSENAEEQQQSLVLSKEVAQDDPTSLISYAIPAGVYMSRWLRHHNKDDAAKAKAYYQQWLAHAPASNGFRSTVETCIRTLDGG